MKKRTRTIHIRLNDGAYESLRRAANEHGLSMASLCRMMLEGQSEVYCRAFNIPYGVDVVVEGLEKQQMLDKSEAMRYSSSIVTEKQKP